MTDVLIVGAGPVGLFLAVRLQAAGRSVRIVEAHAGQSEFSKALAIMPRTMEVFRIAGISPAFEAAAYRVTQARFLLEQQTAGTVPLEAKGSWFDYVAMVPQNLTERLLLEAFVAGGGAVEYETQLVAFVDGPDGVSARLQSASGEERTSARYLVGCDGAHSIVRHLIGFGFDGGNNDEAFVLADVDTVGEVPEGELTICIHSTGLLAMFPLSAKRKRMIATVDAASTSDVTLDLANQLLGERGPRDLGATKLHWGSRFRIQHRQAPGMQKGSIFLAGDAAHVHSPFGGQGMNTGLQDAFNLAWKIDYTLAGFATNALLPSYTAERHPIARGVIKATDIGTRVFTSKNPLVRTARDYALPNVLGMQQFRDFFFAKFSGLANHYEHSPIVAGDGRRAADEIVRVGERERRLYDVIEHRYRIVYPATATAGVVAAFENFARHYGGAIETVAADSDSGLPLVRLVRPDGYLALETAVADDPTPALEKLAGVLSTHVRRLGRSSAASG